MGARGLWIVNRAIVRAESPGLARRQAPWVVGLLFVGVVGAQVIPYHALRAASSEAEPAQMAAVMVVGVAVLAAALARTARDSLFGPRWDLWQRQPLSAWALSPATAWVLFAWTLPFGALAWVFWPVGWSTGVVATVGLSAALLGLAGGGWRGSVVAGCSLLAVFSSVAAVQAAAALDPVVGVFGLAAAGLVGPARRWLHRVRGPRLLALPGRAMGPFDAYVRRDLLALARTSPLLLLGVLLPPGPVAVLMGGVASHGWSSQSRARIAGFGLALAVPGAAWVLLQLRVVLKQQFDPAKWGVRRQVRLASLALLAAGALTPTWAAAAVAGQLPVAGQVQTAGVGLGLTAAVVWSICGQRIPAVPGRVLWACVGLYVVVGLDLAPPLGALAVGAAFAVLALGALRRLRGLP